ETTGWTVSVSLKVYNSSNGGATAAAAAPLEKPDTGAQVVVQPGSLGVGTTTFSPNNVTVEVAPSTINNPNNWIVIWIIATSPPCGGVEFYQVHRVPKMGTTSGWKIQQQ